MTLKRVVKHVDCEFCTPSTMQHCVVCGGNGWVELAVWRNDEEGPGAPEGRGQVREARAEMAPDQEERQ